MNFRILTTTRHLFLIFTLFAFTLTLSAIPAKPGHKRMITLSDGSVVEARLVGDEFGHYWLSKDGKAYISTGKGEIFHEINGNDVSLKAKKRRAKANTSRAKRMASAKVGKMGSYIGKKKGIIILVSFDNSQFNTSLALFKRIANEKNFKYGSFEGSMYDYFYAQSDGKFELEFDVIGPVKVSKNYSYYGQNDSEGNDMYPATMVSEACKLADGQVNFANYDWDKDGYVDQVYVVYAGKGEADGGAANTIWPHAWDLESAAEYNDGDGVLTLDNVKINTYACGGELDGYTGEVAGIGTMCHEFSHCLGYPDFYDTDYSGGQGMGYWDLMDSGSYNGDGYQPAGYTSYERWVAGWREPIELNSSLQVSKMKSLQEGGESYIIYNKGHEDEFYLLENRQFTGWDASLPGKGLLILHCDYDASVWKNNEPNDNPNHQRMTWIAADDKYQYTIDNGEKRYTFDGMKNDPFPYSSINSFGPSSKPAAKLFNRNTDGTYYLDSSIENITQNNDGTISFQFKGASTIATPVFSPKAGVYGEAQTVSISCTTPDVAIYYTMDGTNPDTNSTKYDGPILIETTTTLKAIAVNDVEESKTATARYVIRSGASDTKNFKLVRSTSEIVSGLRYIIACAQKEVAASSLKDTYLSDTKVDVCDDIITINDDVTVFTLEGSGNTYTLMNEDGDYLYSPANKKISFDSEEQFWTLEDDESGVIMEYNENGIILYNANATRFNVYTSSPNAGMIYANLYMETDETPKQEVTLSFDKTTINLTIGEKFEKPTLTSSVSGLSITYTSSNPSVATVDANTGEVTILSEGTATITATSSATDTYNSTSASYEIIVKGIVIDDGSVKYELVDNINDIAESNEVIIVATDNNIYYAMSKSQNANNRSATIVELNSDGTISGNEDVQDIIMEKDGENWLFNVGDNYLYAASSSKNYLRTQETPDNNSVASINISNGISNIKFQGQYTHNLLKFNPNNGLPIFSCYLSGQKDVMIYKKVKESTQFILGDADGNGTVNVTDVMVVVYYILHDGYVGNFYFKNADVDNNGTINVVDAMLIVDIILKQE